MNTRFLAVITLGLALALPARAQNLLTNPSFESGGFVDSGNGFMQLGSGNSSLTGWSIDTGTISWGTTPNSTNIVASAGTKFLNLAGFHPNTPNPWGRINQGVVLTSGVVYQLSFDLGCYQGNPALHGPVTVHVTAFGTVLNTTVTFTPTGTNTATQWGRFNLNFTAPFSATGTVTFQGISAGGRYIGLDNVALIAVPAAPQHLVVDTTFWIPGGSGNFTSLTAPSLSGGNVAFYGAGASGQQGIYAFPTSPIGGRLVADTSTAIPNGTGNFTGFGMMPAVSGGNVAFYGEGATGQQGIYVSFASGPIGSRLADLTTAIPGGAGNFTGFGMRPALSGVNVAYYGTGASGQQGIYVAFPPGPVGGRIADTSTAIPGGAGNFTGFMAMPVLSGNLVAFIGTGASGQQGVYYAEDGVLEKIVDTSTAIPGGTGNFTGFPGALAMPSPQFPSGPIFVGHGSGGQQGVYAAPASGPVKVADLNTMIPGGTGMFTGFGAVSTDAGIAAFIGTGTAGQSGLYTLHSGRLLNVVAAGDMVDGQTVSGVALAAGGMSGDPVALTLTFSDSSQAIYTEELADADDFRITAVTALGAHLGLSHTTQPGFKYVVQANSDLVTGTWSATAITNTGTGFVIDTVVSNALTATAQQFYRAQLVAGSYASDSAVDPAYSGGWTNGSNGGVGFGPWILTGSAGHFGWFIGSSTNNAFVTAPGIDVGGESWGVFADSSSDTAEYRTFAGNSLAVGQSLLLDMDNGLIDAGQSDGFTLRSGGCSNDPSCYNVGERFEFLIIGGGSDYQVIDAGGQHDLGVAFTGTGLHLVFTLTGTDAYTLLTIDNATSATNTWSGTLAGSGTLDNIALYNRNAGSGSANDCYFNSLQIISP